jgi:histidinol-phosphate/aromatic aminotransferase/cobyric acid decarboxylase-like protein
VRAYHHQRLLDAIRISVGLPEHTDAVVAALDEWCEAHLDERHRRPAWWT